MAIVVNKKEVVEEIIDENGNKLGEIRFNPKDSRIMNKLSKIIADIEKALKEQKKIGEIEDISETELNSAEDFEKVFETFEKIDKYLDIEMDIIQKIVDELSEVFGEDTVKIFTGGTLDITTIEPLLDCIIPYVKKARQEKVDKYIVNNSDVME